MDTSRKKKLSEILAEETSIKITISYPAEIKELVDNGYTNNRAGKRKRIKELKKKRKSPLLSKR